MTVARGIRGSTLAVPAHRLSILQHPLTEPFRHGGRKTAQGVCGIEVAQELGVGDGHVAPDPSGTSRMETGESISTRQAAPSATCAWSQSRTRVPPMILGV